MLKWFSNDEGESGSGAPGSPHGGSLSREVQADEMTDRLVQTQQLVTQLKELIREKDAVLCTKDEQLKMEKEACEAKLSKLRLQNKAKVTSLTTQLEELKKQMGGQNTPTHNKKGPSEGGEPASRGKIVLLKKKVEELEQHLAQSEKEVEKKRKEVEAQRLRGEEMDVMLTEKDRKLAEKEAYIIHLQIAVAGDQPITPKRQKVDEDNGAMQELQQLVQNLTKKVGEAEERYSLLQEQTDSLKELLDTEKEQYSQKESMYKQNIQTFKEIIIQKDNQLTEINQMHEQELFKLAAKSDASADLEQLLKALKQKLHEKEEVLIGKTQVIDVLQTEVDGRDQQIKELTERIRRLHVERESLESKMEAEKHVMRAQLRDLIDKQQVEIRQMTVKHQAQLNQTQQDLLGQIDDLRRNAVTPQSVNQEAPKTENVSDDSASVQRIAELEAQTKQKMDEASKSEAKFLKMKAWSKSRIRQLEEELKKSQAGIAPPDLTALRSRITELEAEREENLWKVEQYEELKANSDMLEAKLVVYEEQQRTLQADLEQFTKRATSQASESGSADDAHSQVLEWQEMVDEAVSARDQAKEEKAAMVLRISHMEEEREGLIEDDWFFPGCSDSALATRQQELEEELAQAQGLSQHRAKKLAGPAQRSVQEDFEFDGKAPFQDYHSTLESTTPMEGENMGGGVRTVVEELELERNQLQEQILSLEERCQGLEDRLQLQARIETLQVTFDVNEDEQPNCIPQNETEKLQTQLASVRSQQNREAEKHQLLVSSLNEQLKRLSDTQECLESSLIEKENTLAKTSEKLELINRLKESLSEKEIQYKQMSDKLLQTEQTLESVSKKSSISENRCSELKAEVIDLTQRMSGLRDKSQKQDIILDTLQSELDQTNEELDKLNTTHLEERAQLIHDLQSCEREIDSLKETLLEKDKVLNSNMLESTEQITFLKQELRLKEENIVQVENALTKAHREAAILRDSQTADQQALNSKMAELVDNLKDVEMELDKAKEENKSKVAEMDCLIKQAKEDKKSIQNLQSKTQKQIVSHHTQISEGEALITSLKEQLNLATQKQHESDALILQLKEINTNNEKNILNKEETYENELKTVKDEKNKLLSQVQKFNHDIELLSKELKDRAQSEDNVQQEMEKCKEIIASLENQLKANVEQAMDERQSYNAELQVRESENKKLRKELDDGIENISKMKDRFTHMESEKQQLQEKLKNLTENLELQNLNGNQLNDKLTSALELNNNLKNQVQNLTKENEKLGLEVAETVATVSEMTSERDSLHAKLSTLESQHLQNNSMIHELEKNKEDLILQASDLKRLLEQSKLSNDEVVLAKTNECSHLKQLLREKEDAITQLQGQLQSSSSELDELRVTVGKKEQFASDLQAELEAQRSEQMQLKETLSLLQEQGCSLKSGLLEKDTTLKEKQEECHRLRDEIISHKNSVSELQVELESLNSERSQLCKDLEERERMMENMAHQCQKHKDDFDGVKKTVKALKNEINEMEEKSKKLKSEADSSATELRTLKAEMQTIAEENQQLHTVVKSREKELDEKIQIVSNLDRQLKVTLEQNSSFSMTITSLTEENERLQKELAHNISLALEVKTETNLLKEENSKLEVQVTNDEKIINTLLNEKNELIGSVSNAKQVLQEKEMSNKECLLEKTNECSTLSETLSEREQRIQTLQEQVNDLKNQISQLNLSMAEKEDILFKTKSLLEAQQVQQLQLQDTISMLQEQGSVLKTGLMEKDTMFQQKSDECLFHQNEVKLQKDLVSQMQRKVESVRQECFEAKQQLEQKEHMLQDVTSDFENQKEELRKRSQCVIKLESQLLAVNNNLAEMQITIATLKDSVVTLTLENSRLKQENEQMKAEVIDFKDAIQALNDQNVRLKSELQKSFVELSKSQEALAHLKTAVHESKLQLKTARSEKDCLSLTVQGKDDSLKELKGRIFEQEEQLKQKDNETFSLRVQVTELGDSVCKLSDQVQTLTSESTTLKNILEQKEQSSLEDQRNVTLANETLNVNLKNKEKECEILKAQISHLEENSCKINSTLQMQTVETKNLKKALEERDCSLMEQSQSLEDLQRTADELLLFKTQFMESTELVSQLQSEMQMLSSDVSKHKMSAEEKQSALIDLQEKYAANLEDLQDLRKQLSQRTDEVLTLQTLSDERDTAKTAIEALREELSAIQRELEKTQNLNSQLSKEKDDAFASHQTSVYPMKVEIERLKAQHLQVVAQMNALTENLEQREMSLHAINNQYTAQAKHTSHLISEIQKLDLQNKKLHEEINLAKEEHQSSLTAVSNENARLIEDIRKHLAEKEELERRHHQICESQGELKVQLEQQTSSMSESIQQMVCDKESLQTKVSAQDEEISRLKGSIHKMEQILQDTEKEWLLVLDREKHDKTLLVEQLSKVEKEIASKDDKVNVLKQDLDSLQEKLAEAFSAISKGSDLLSAKEFEASTSRVQLEKVMALVKEKDNETENLQQTLKAAEWEVEQLAAKFSGAEAAVFAPSREDTSHLHQLIKQVEASHYSEIDALKNKLDSTRADLEKMQNSIDQENKSHLKKSQEISLLQEKIENLQSQLKSETQKVTEASLEHSSLHGELKTKDDQINSMTIQISHQKELLIGLSQQLKEKDASISQIMESALNDRVKLDGENAYLSKQLAMIKQDYHSSTRQSKEISLPLEERNSCSLSENETQTSEKLGLLQENTDLKCEIARISKDNDTIKKKLKASLLVRKDLLKKVEEFEKKYAGVNNDHDVSRLQEKLVEATTQAQSAAEVYEERISLLEKKCLDKERELHYHKMQTEKLAEQLESETKVLQSTVSEKESCLADMLQQLDEKSILIHQLQARAAEQEDSFERDKKSLMKNVEELQNKITGCTDQSKDAFSIDNADVLENKRTQMKQEKTMLENKTLAASLARQETLQKVEDNEKQSTKGFNELKDEYNALLEQHYQQTNEFTAIQLKYNQSLAELEQLQRTSLSNLDELKILRHLVQERDATVQYLKTSLAERERDCYPLSKLPKQLEIQDKALILKEESAEALASNLQTQSAIKEEKVLVEKSKEKFKGVEVLFKQEKQGQLKTNGEKCQDTMEENKTHLDQVLTLQSVLTEAQQLLCEKEDSFTKMLGKAQLDCTEKETDMVSLKKDNENALRIMNDLRTELGRLHAQLNQCHHVKELIYEEIAERSIKEEHVKEEELSSANRWAEDMKTAQKPQDAKSAMSEKDELIAALHLQLQQLSSDHEASIMKMKREIDHLHKSQDCDKVSDEDSHHKMTLLTKKLQAALVSRKELMKENASLKEQVGNLSANINTKEAECLALESSFSRLKQHNVDLEINMKCINTDKEKLRSEVDRICHENCCLADACESLKQTIENITQQKQAFSCQLESLKDSQTEELTKWKSRHSELKQDYETLLQAYENVGTEMDKMRQLLEGAKCDRQEALRKLHKSDTEMEILQGQAKQVEEEHERLKEKMQTFSEEKQHTIEGLQQANDSIKKELAEINEAHRMAICELTKTNQHCETEILQFKSALEACKDQIADMQVKNRELTEKLQASHSLEKQCMESSSYRKSMQHKLDETPSVNGSLTAQIESKEAEFSAQLESCHVLQKENKSLSERIEKLHNDHEMQLRRKDDAIHDLKDKMKLHNQETISLNEKVRILEDDKCLLQEELENVQESSDKVKNENEYLETVVLNSSKKIDALSESISVLQAQNLQLSSQLTISKEINDTLRQEKEDGHLKLVRDFENKLKAMQRGEEGSKNTNKELQELLKEKHQEINQLQQNCIKYQEHILHLESSLKASEFACENLKKDLNKCSDKTSVVEEQNKQVEANLIACKTHIQVATERIGKLQLERDHLKLSLEHVRSEEKTKLKESTVEKEFNSFKDNDVMLQKQIDDLKNLNDKESQKVTELTQQMNSQDLKMKFLKRALETNEAKLSALSSTPHGANAAKLWNDLYLNALQEKDNQLTEQGSAMKRLLEGMRVSEKELNDLRSTKSRLESAISMYSVASAAHQRQILVLSASNVDLSETVERLTVQVNELGAQVKKVEQDQTSLEIQVADQEDEISRLHLHCNLTEKINADLDSQLLVLRAENDKAKAEFETQKGISLQMKTLLQSKDAEISSLLSCRDDHMLGYLQQLQTNCQSQEAAYEDRLRTLQYQRQKADKEFRELEATVRSLQISLNRSVQEKEQMSAKMEVVKKSFVSLQREKEQLMSEYRILEAKSHSELKSEEYSPDNEGGATKGLKHEIKKLLHQMDDLNSENAMLRAQLIRYREDLNQVLSLKDNQLKVLLKKQEDVIKNLEKQKTAAEKDHTEALSVLQNEIEVRKADLSTLRAQVTKLQSDRVSQKATTEGKVVADLQQIVPTKTAECIDLQQTLRSQETQINDLTKQMERLETDKKLANSDDQHNTEWAACERETELMRTEKERAEQRVTAKGLLETEQQLLEAQRQNRDTKAQNESLCKAMAALQNDRDQLIEDFKVLRNRYDEELRETQAALNKVQRGFQAATSDVEMFTKERAILVDQLRALESKNTHAELNKLLGELRKTLSEKEKQLKQVDLENSTYNRQLSAFSKSMASLQNDRDRLVDELAEATRVIESRQGSGLKTVSTMNEKKSKGSASQIEKHGAMNELWPRLTPDVEASSLPNETAVLRSERGTQPVEETVNPVGQIEMEKAVSRLEAERVHLHRELQRCLYDIQQRDQCFQQLNSKLQQAVEEKGAVAAQLLAVSQTLRDTQNRCHCLEMQGQAQGSGNLEVAPGGPQERNNTVAQTIEVGQLQERLLEVERSLADERCRRESAEEALHLAQASTKSISSRLPQDIRRDFSSIEMEADDEWEAVSLNPNQPLITRKVKGGMVACRRWFRGRSLYFSRLLTGRARSRYFFLGYLVTIHLLVLMCLTGAL
ncbi:golgin subfamily B member 1-like isoform X2 [Hippocampus comes]|uniref:golgin subfamily B member 1-like isoform X2 n=1 Tax=Hippocampus comes TaxID=109280 RepID=UPI00094E2238|nr:PREDICTED: golgin subfamily B member 1-like isoform X2 [Hippocampus comes]